MIWKKDLPPQKYASGALTIGRRRREPQEQQIILLCLTFVRGDNRNFQMLF